MTRAKRRGRSSLADAELELTPMIDIVFNLLIFFMCATKFRTPEGLIEAFLPRDRGQVAGPTQHDTHQVRIRLRWVDANGRPAGETPAGSLRLAIGELLLHAPGDEEDALRAAGGEAWGALHERLLALKAAYQGSAPEGLPVIVDAAPAVPTRHVVSALNEVVRAGIRDVTFAAPERPS